MEKNVSDCLVEMLASQGVQRMYGLAGDSLNPVMEALERDGSIRWIHVRHEETAAFAAAGEAMISGGLAACCGSCGPGNMHLINGLYDAHRSAVPVFALASHIATINIGTDYFQETHPTQFFAECTRYCELVNTPAQAPTIIGSAIRSGLAEPGVGMVVLPGDIASRALPKGTTRPMPVKPQRAPRQPSETALEELAHLINAVKRVTFLCGAGCVAAQRELISLARKTAAPIAYTLRAKEFMEPDNPLGIGMTGLIGWGDATRAIHEAELLILWGTDFPYSSFLPRHGRVVQVDTRAEALGRRVPLCLGIHADVLLTARGLLPLIRSDREEDFLDRCLSRHGKELLRLQARVRSVDEQAPIRPEYLTKLVSDQAEPDAVFTVDTGTPVIWAARFIQAMPQRRVIGSFKHGSMACALAMSIGAKAHSPSRQVIALCGDGGLSMLPGDLLTLLQENLAVKILVYNNSSLDFVALEQELGGMPHMGTALPGTNYAAIARAMGLTAYRVETPGNLPAAVHDWLSTRTPALLDVVIDTHALGLPPNTDFLSSLDYFRHPQPPADPEAELSPVRRMLYAFPPSNHRSTN